MKIENTTPQADLVANPITIGADFDRNQPLFFGVWADGYMKDQTAIANDLTLDEITEERGYSPADIKAIMELEVGWRWVSDEPAEHYIIKIHQPAPREFRVVKTETSVKEYFVTATDRVDAESMVNAGGLNAKTNLVSRDITTHFNK